MDGRILVGVDGSGPSLAALRWATDFARDDSYDLVLEHVVDTSGRPSASVLADAAAQATAVGRRSTQVLAHGVPEHALVTAGEPGDLLVIGTHKTGFLRGRVMGTRSVSIATTARCSVVVVPEVYSLRAGRVVVGVASGDRSASAVVAAARFATRHRQELVLVHASEDADEVTGAEVLEWAATVAASAAPGVTIRRRSSRRRVADALLDASRVASLLVIGGDRAASGHTGGLGAVISEVLLNLNSPVMIVR